MYDNNDNNVDDDFIFKIESSRGDQVINCTCLFVYSNLDYNGFENKSIACIVGKNLPIYLQERERERDVNKLLANSQFYFTFIYYNELSLLNCVRI